MKQKKLRELEESYELGMITKEEHEEKKKEIEEMPEEKKPEKKDEEPKEAKFKSDKILIIGAVLLILVFAVVFGIRFFTQEQPQTIEDLHALNFKGKLKPDQGYLYRDVYSFVKFEDSWYTQFKSPKGSRLYNVQFRYGPKEVEDIRISGSLDLNMFNNATDYYVTFNPKGNDFSHVALAAADFNQHMTTIFFKQPIGACDRNETFTCRDRPIVTCDSTDKVVLYVKEANESKASFNDNCIIVEGNGFDLVKEIDRVLYVFYEIMEQ
ncbi:hypothetical protein HYU09_01650 [Candidatus Woesearchaeota archaeon]|nr:hypothetical protein [Candidatus Woesearchaeota archaeon]